MSGDRQQYAKVQKTHGMMHTRLGVLCGVAVLISVLCGNVVFAQGLYMKGTTGHDVSWPKANCKANIPAGTAFGVLGVTGGLDFTKNTCLVLEAGEFTSPSLYMNTGFPGTTKMQAYDNAPKHCGPGYGSCVAYNYGYQAAMYGILYADSQDVHSATWWLDVETDNSWTIDYQENQAALQGMMAAIRQQVPFSSVGIYSTPLQWMEITGGWKNGLMNWVGTGSVKRSDALAACTGSNFTGGGTELTQYILRLDNDYVCR